MRILFTGGGSGGHFYPIIAVAESLQKLAISEKLLEPELLYMANKEYDRQALFDLNITYVPISAGKARRYFSLKNILDVVRTGWGIFTTFWQLLFMFPDVIFSKGGGTSFPPLVAARILGIPVIIHESDTYPGRANAWAGKFAKRIAVAFPDAAKHFKKERVAVTGLPIRKDLQVPTDRGAHEFLDLETGIPVILVLGGSQGSQLINEALIETLPELVNDYQIIHQTGPTHIESIQKLAELYLEKSEHKTRYRAFGFLDVLAMRMAAGAADIVITRAGATSLFEIAAWGTPSIIIPITDTNGDHQRQNAFAYARTGAGEVIEERNLTPHLLKSEIQRILNSSEERKNMEEAARAFATPEAADTIAREILDLALEHEKQ